MSRASRDKGSRGEREVADRFRAAGFPCARTPNSGAMQWKGDVNGVPFCHIEVKRQERIQIVDWSEQAEADCPNGDMPLVVWRRSRDDWRVTLPLDDFIELLQAGVLSTTERTDEVS